jgi:glycosyltransferase involved in cell wall biosynthesis
MSEKKRVEPPRVSVVAPCYNEENGLAELHRRVSNVCREVAGDSYEIVLVNDGSTDNTWATMVLLSSVDPHLVAVNLSRNHGHQLALSAGLSICAGERILIIDADLQDPPELLPQMMVRLDAGCDVVYGQRVGREGETWFKRATAKVFYRLLKRLVDIEIPLDTGDFRLMSRRVLDILNAMPEQNRFVRGMVSWIGLRQESLSYRREARYAGETKYPLSKMFRFAVDAITGFSVRPLRMASYIGGIAGVFGILLLLYVLGSWLSGATVAGWTSLMVIVLILGSVQLFVIGLLGEYLGRLYMESKRRPLFVIDSIVRGDVADPKPASTSRNAERIPNPT